MLLVLVDSFTPRIAYTFEFIFKDRKIDYSLTESVEDFKKSSAFKINYSSTQVADCYALSPTKILYDFDVKYYSTTKSNFEHFECLAFNGTSDPCASIFYILTRYEEYFIGRRDQFGRFSGKQSTLFKFNWHEQAICDRWSTLLIQCIEKYYNKELKPLKIPATSIPSFDIDNAYAYKNKGFFRTTLSVCKDLLLARRHRMKERRLVLMGRQRDPYDTFDRIYSLSELGLKINVFWLLGDFSKYDKNISYRNEKQKRLIKKMAEKCQIGIHPSVKSNEYEYFLHNEIERLSLILKKTVIRSRQHFLKLKIPETYRTLVQQEIRNDHTMGFADIVGFRCGTARPHFWFDVEKNKKTSLVIRPFMFMDGTLNEYLHLNPDQAIEKINRLFDEVSTYGGEFSFIWHNETIGDYGSWKGWSKVFKHSIEQSIKMNEK